jgi:hypothetical protein
MNSVRRSSYASQRVSVTRLVRFKQDIELDERVRDLSVTSRNHKFINLMRLRASPILRSAVTIKLARSNRLQPTFTKAV